MKRTFTLCFDFAKHVLFEQRIKSKSSFWKLKDLKDEDILGFALRFCFSRFDVAATFR